MNFDLKSYLENKRLLIDHFLSHLLPEDGPLSRHYASLRYSLLAGGKRVRPILCLAAAEALHATTENFLPVACALECIHTYSLIHDDLPAMDNDELRRGKPTNHKVFGEAEAILAGDGLLTLSFDILSDPALAAIISHETLLRIVSTIAKAAGSAGMVGGQALDIAAEGKTVSLEELQAIHRCKTGALITASIQAGAILGMATNRQFADLTTYGGALGLAFQIKDDLLDVEGTTERLGKSAGADAELKKATYPSLLGVEETRHKLQMAIDEALSALQHFDEAVTPLRAIAHYILNRTR